LPSGKPTDNGQPPPLDIIPDWLNVVRAAQAACKGNDGFGVMTITVALMGNTPVLYEPKLRRKLHPSSAAKKEMTPRVAGALMALMDMHADEPVIVPEIEEELT
jgi:hypothetical protein